MTGDDRARLCAAAVTALGELRAAIARTFAAERHLRNEATSLRAKARGDVALLAHAATLDADADALAGSRARLAANERPLFARIVALRGTLEEHDGVTRANDHP